MSGWFARSGGPSCHWQGAEVGGRPTKEDWGGCGGDAAFCHLVGFPAGCTVGGERKERLGRDCGFCA